MAALPESWLARGAVADPMRPVFLAVRRRVQETADTFTLVLEPAAGGAPLRFEPGQFNMLYLPGVGEVPISISGDPARPELLVHTIRAVGAVTRGLGKLGPGNCVGVRGPFGTPWPVAQAQGRDVLVVAGGIGLAPLRPALYHLLARRGQYGRVALLYGARTPADILYARELREWRGRFDVDVAVTVDRATPEWQGAVGVVTRLIDRAALDPSTLTLLCGPELMMRFSVQALVARGLSEASMFVSLERNMQCAVGSCGHCQIGPLLVCRDGPVFPYERVAEVLSVREV
jgi:NAD(P)H-flavin reductase